MTEARPPRLLSSREGIRLLEPVTGRPYSVAATLKAVPDPKIVLVYIYDETNASATELKALARAVEDHGVIHAFLIGPTTAVFAPYLEEAGFTHVTQRTGETGIGRSFNDAVAIAEPGDSIMLLCIAGAGAHSHAVTAYRKAVAQLQGAFDESTPQ